MPTASLLPFVASAKQLPGFWFARYAHERLWQEGYFDHVLRDDEDELEFIVYILANPIVRGMTTNLGEYAFAGSDMYSIEQITEAMRERGMTLNVVPGYKTERGPRRG